MLKVFTKSTNELYGVNLAMSESIIDGDEKPNKENSTWYGNSIDKFRVHCCE